MTPLFRAYSVNSRSQEETPVKDGNWKPFHEIVADVAHHMDVSQQVIRERWDEDRGDCRRISRADYAGGFADVWIQRGTR